MMRQFKSVRRRQILLCMLPVSLVMTAGVVGQTVTTAPAARPGEKIVVAVVNGEPIFASDVHDRTQSMVDSLPPESKFSHAQIRVMMMQRMEGETLLRQACEAARIEITDEMVRRFAREELEAYLIANDVARRELETNLRLMRGITLDEFLRQRIDDPTFRGLVEYYELAKREFPNALIVNDGEVEKYYRMNVDRIFTTPERVRAQMILFRVKGTGPKARAAARKRAEEALALARQPGADFAALAKKLSDDPSGRDGGDLGRFAEQGFLPERISLTAFMLKPGEVSDLIGLEDAFAIIKLTEILPSKVLALEDVRSGAEYRARDRQVRAEKKRYIERLREQAVIDYPHARETPPAENGE